MDHRLGMIDGSDDILNSDGWLGMDHRLGMIDGSDDILDSDGILGSDAPSDRDDRRLG
jgi:hypothetical protein